MPAEVSYRFDLSLSLSHTRLSLSLSLSRVSFRWVVCMDDLNETCPLRLERRDKPRMRAHEYLAHYGHNKNNQLILSDGLRGAYRKTEGEEASAYNCITLPIACA